MRLGVHVDIVALPAATLGTKGIALPGTPASPATTPTIPTTAILCQPFLTLLSSSFSASFIARSRCLADASSVPLQTLSQASPT